MANNPQAKLKTLYVMRILQEETDADHGLSMRQLIDRLGEYGIEAERKGVYRDIGILREFGLDIQTYQRNPVEYAIERRDFSLSQLMLLVDAVESCKALTSRQSQALTRNLKLLASDGQRELLSRRIHVPDRIASKSESVFGHIDLLHDAMRRRRKVAFMYYKRGLDGERYATHEGLRHEVTPVGITYADGFYYLTAWSEEFDRMSEFRIDRMDKLVILDDPATKNDQITAHRFEGDPHMRFGRFMGEPVTATLQVTEDGVDIVMDRFGDAAQMLGNDGQTAQAVVKVRKSVQFFGWVAGMNGTVRIAGPASLKEEYRLYLEGLIAGL